MKYILIALIKLYQKIISPFFPLRCRFIPSCSEYTIQAVKKYGVFKGGWLGIKRISKCRPFGKGGYDPLK
jgi:uncharacterized protein